MSAWVEKGGFEVSRGGKFGEKMDRGRVDEVLESYGNGNGNEESAVMGI